MKHCEKCLAKNGNFYFFVMALQTSCGTFHQRKRERVTLQTSCGAERVNLLFQENFVSHLIANSRYASKCCEHVSLKLELTD